MLNPKLLRMKNLLKLSTIFLLLLNACSTENIEEVTPEAQDSISQELITNLSNNARTATSTNQESDYVEDGECFVINYPYNVSDGQTSTTINSDEELFAYLNDLEFDSDFFIEVPFDVTLSDGSQQTITSYEALEMLLEACYGFDDFDDDFDDGFDDGFDEDECFVLNYPLTALDFDGNEVTVNSEEDLYTFEFAGFVYPISVTLTDGTQQTINSSQEFDSLYNDCYDIEDCYDCGELCFEIVFPMTFVSENGTVVTVSDYDELWDFISQLTEEDVFVVSYPITVQFEDGTQQTANNDEEFEALYAACE